MNWLNKDRQYFSNKIEYDLDIKMATKTNSTLDLQSALTRLRLILEVKNEKPINHLQQRLRFHDSFHAFNLLIL